MRLGQLLYGKGIPFIFRGKYRKIKEPTIQDLIKLRNDFEREEQNMLILRHPYLTVEQSYGHMAALKAERGIDTKPKHSTWKDVKFTKEITIADRLSHLKVRDVWD